MLVQHTSPTYMPMTSWERRPTSYFASSGVGAATISPPCSLSTSHEQSMYPPRAVDSPPLRFPMENLESNQLTDSKQTPQLSMPLPQPFKSIYSTLEKASPDHSISYRPPPPSPRRGRVCGLHMPLARRPVSSGPPSVSLPVSPTPMFRIRDDLQSDFFWVGNSGSMSPHSNTSSNAAVQSWPSSTQSSAESESSSLYSRIVFNPRTSSSAFNTLSTSSKLSDQSASSSNYGSSIKSPDEPRSSSQERMAQAVVAWSPNEAQTQAKNHSVISNRGLDQEASFRKHNLTFQGMLDSKGDFSRVRVWKSEKGLTFYDCTCGKRRPDQGLKKIKHHAQRHSIRQHACDICGKVYGHHCSLNAHKRVHKRRSESACEKIKPKLP